MTVIQRHRFERLYAAHFDTVLRYCLRRTNREDALDAAGETFAVAWRRRHDLPWDRPLPWLYGVAHRVLSNQRRSLFRQSRMAARLRGSEVADDPGPEVQVLRAAEDQQVLDTLEELSADDREIIRLAAWEELSRDEIAAVLGCSSNAVTKRLNRALDHLADLLGGARSSGIRFFRRERTPA
ncbi:MAG: sigma-70 family RNA polymerase sigma factor [Gemmatimonadetes bacterium]|nr:sigma-70 family RNA polymerase sigma factor [Gemmatimonadota bacterium]